MIDPRFLRLAALVSGLIAAPVVSLADGWDAFVARCLTPYEAQFPPIVEGLEQVSSPKHMPAYAITEHARLVVELEPDDAFTACRLVDKAGLAETAFDRWISDQVALGRYEPAGKDRWESFQWIEPKVAVQKQQGAPGVILRVMETYLES